MSTKTQIVKTPVRTTKTRKTPLSAAIASAAMALKRAQFRKSVSETRADAIVKVAQQRAAGLREDAKQYDALIKTLGTNLESLHQMDTAIAKMGIN